jgi:oligopeptide/dipeptide ABC transporter ATP-binding protein
MGLTYLFIAHNLAVVRYFADRVAVMYLGRIVEIADREDLFARPRQPYTMALLAAAPHPDPTRRRKTGSISGDVPSPLKPPEGCAFHPRCPYATDVCREAVPPLEEQPGSARGHHTACHHAREVSYCGAPVGGS